jgi:hypothetical protein
MAKFDIQRISHQWSFAAVAVGVAVVVLILAYFLIYRRSQSVGSDETRNAVRPSAIITEVKTFTDFVRDNPAEEKMGLDHNYSSDSIRLLSAALSSLAREHNIKDPDIEQRVKSLEQYADRLQEDKRSTEHADLVRDAFISITDLITDLENRIHSDQSQEIGQLRQAAQSIDPNQLLLKQKAQMQEFFTRASAVLQAMSQSGWKE